MVSRYGAKIRKREEAVLKSVRQKHECPTCGKKKVKRKGFAMWECNSCKAVFAGGAYSPETEAGKNARKQLQGK
jgi:large subunit ribosomal protein L37Ae